MPIINYKDKNGTIKQIPQINIINKADRNEIIDMVYPIGSIYLSVNPTNPKILLGGGEWTQWGTGKVPVGIDSSDTDFDTVEKTGGEKEHILLPGEMPRHTHPTRVGDVKFEYGLIAGSRS